MLTTARSSAIRTRLRLVISPYEKLGALVQKLSPPRKLPVFFVIVWIVSLAFSISDATRLTVLDSAAANEVKGSYPWYYCNNVGACGTANPCPTTQTCSGTAPQQACAVTYVYGANNCESGLVSGWCGVQVFGTCSWNGSAWVYTVTSYGFNCDGSGCRIW